MLRWSFVRGPQELWVQNSCWTYRLQGPQFLPRRTRLSTTQLRGLARRHVSQVATAPGQPSNHPWPSPTSSCRTPRLHTSHTTRPQGLLIGVFQTHTQSCRGSNSPLRLQVPFWAWSVKLGVDLVTQRVDRVDWSTDLSVWCHDHDKGQKNGLDGIWAYSFWKSERH